MESLVPRLGHAITFDVSLLHGRDEAISGSRHRLNKRTRAFVVAERFRSAAM